MIRFVDLETGNTFDGSSQYIFWFDNEQSTNLIYSKPICFISDNEDVNISIEKNDIFKLIDTDPLSTTQKYHNINELYIDSLVSKGSLFNTYYVHLIYIICRSGYEGEYICKFFINNESFNIGADFYGEDETLRVNLSNNGIEIPDAIQKAIYPVNVHEDNRDNITLNRKWKELLSNYWDIVANKGSYKSLYNSLNWFEYGDVLRLCELWKYNDYGIKYEAQDLQSILKDKYEESKNDFAKTTYIALYCSLEKIKKENDNILYDDEKNPILEKITHQWSVADLALKLSMLGNFYETYFMPIHLDLIHATIENITFANTSGLDIAAQVNRTDYIYHHHDIKCNIEDNSIYNLGVVECYANPDTLFMQKNMSRIRIGVDDNGMNIYRYYIKPENIIGVSHEPYKGCLFKINNLGELVGNGNTDVDPKKSDFNLYAAQMYKDIGAIIDFEIEVPLFDNDFIKKETIYIYNLNNTAPIGLIDYKIIKDQKFKFSILHVTKGKYHIKLQFETATGYVFTKDVNYEVKDTEHDDIRVYKIQHLPEQTISRISCFDYNYNDVKINDYITTRRNIGIRTINNQPNAQLNKYVRYIPSLTLNLIDDVSLYDRLKSIDSSRLDDLMDLREQKVESHKGVCLNHLLVFRCNVQDKNNSDQTADFLYEEESGGSISISINTDSNVKNKKWGDCWDVINQYYDIRFCWKGGHPSNPSTMGNAKLYAICVSKLFSFNTDLLLYHLSKKGPDVLDYFKTYCILDDNIQTNVSQTHIYNDTETFIPCYHEMVELNANRIQDIEQYTVTDYDALCVVPTIEYSKPISGYEWEFINMSDPQRSTIKSDISSNQPFIAHETERFLEPGYYSIKFRYNFGDKTNTITLDSAFKKV